MPNKICSIAGCGGKASTRGWCRKHYNRWWTTGDPLKTKAGSVSERFWAKVQYTPSCWLWTANNFRDGYGAFKLDGKVQLAHRVCWNLVTGEPPKELFVDHRFVTYGCPKNCVNPDHLRLATRKQNGENLSGPQKNNHSGVLGVSWNEATQKWTAQVTHNGVRYYLGRFEDIADAEAVVIAKRLELFTHNERDRNSV